ncbi:acyltransferase [Pseudomonas sp. DCB_CB]|nr:acyltransferase [Pseudomonas sp. DCB_BZ]MCX2858858.1 acyltransferase [Pseudomonas sp. DCB_CB]
MTATIPNLGLLAVNFFYVISGFLISLVLHETYNFKFRPFAANRFLRLYPAYFAIAGISLLFAISFESHHQFHVSWSSPPSISDIFGNALIFPWAFLADDIVPVNFLELDIFQSSTSHFRLVPSTWSVGVEIVCYFLLWLFAARQLWSTIATIAIAIAWQWYVLHSSTNPLHGYFPVTAALLPFGLGSLAYHISTIIKLKPLYGFSAISLTIASCILFISNWKLSLDSPNLIGSASYYANNALAFFTVLLINRTSHTGTTKTIDKWLGDLAYPMFLGHYVFGFIAWRILGENSASRGIEVFMLGSAITILASIIVVQVVDKNLMKARNKIRFSAKDGRNLTAVES